MSQLSGVKHSASSSGLLNLALAHGLQLSDARLHCSLMSGEDASARHMLLPLREEA